MDKNIKIKVNKTTVISVRMTPMERNLIESRAKNSGYSLSRYMVEMAIGREVKNLSAEEKKGYVDLANFYTYFSQLGNLIRKKESMTYELQELMKLMKNHLQSMSR